MVRTALFSLLLPSIGLAAPPAVTGLSPAGVQAGQSVNVSLRGTAGDPAPLVWASRPGVTLVPAEAPPEKPEEKDEKKGKQKEKGPEWTLTAAADTPPGIVWLRFHNAEGASDLRPVFVGTLPEISETEPNNTSPQAQKIAALPVVVNGVLHKGGEVDSFAVSLEVGQTLTASLEAHRSLGSPMDAVLQVSTADGFVLLQNDDDRGNDPLLSFTPPRSGEYLVRVFAFPSDPNSTINYAGAETYIYRLLLATGPVVDHVSPLAVTATPSPVQAVGGGVPTDAAPVTPLVIDGEVVLPIKEPTTLLAHRLPVVPHATTVEMPSVDPGVPQLLTIPACVTGHIRQPGEVDTYRFAGKKGESIRIVVDARRFDTPLDPYLRLIGPDGKVVKEQDDEGRKSFDLEFTQSLATDGEYRVEVTDRFRLGGPRSAYMLTLEPATPDFGLSVEANHWVLVPGKPLEIPVAIARLAGFKEEIVVEVQGLPADAGVTVAETKSAAMGDSSKSVKIKLESARKTPLNVPLRIVGKSGTVERKADGPIAGLSDRTAFLWLTVAPPK